MRRKFQNRLDVLKMFARIDVGLHFGVFAWIMFVYAGYKHRSVLPMYELLYASRGMRIRKLPSSYIHLVFYPYITGTGCNSLFARLL